MELVLEQARRLLAWLEQQDILRETAAFPQEFGPFVETLFTRLMAAYPETRLGRFYRSVHYANGFQDEALKQAAYRLDEVERLLCRNGFLDHDAGVEYFNARIFNAPEVNQYTLIATALESLMVGTQN